jgi:hypothetical protein
MVYYVSINLADESYYDNRNLMRMIERTAREYDGTKENILADELATITFSFGNIENAERFFEAMQANLQVNYITLKDMINGDDIRQYMNYMSDEDDYEDESDEKQFEFHQNDFCIIL